MSRVGEKVVEKAKEFKKEGTEYRPSCRRLLLHVYTLRNLPIFSEIFIHKIAILKIIECPRLDLIAILLH